MKPKTKFDRRVVELKDSLPPVSKKIIKWAYKGIMPEGFTYNGDLGYCGHCGKSFQITEETGAHMGMKFETRCPHCGKRLLVNFSKKRITCKPVYVSVMTTYKGIQLWRHLNLEFKFEKKKSWSCKATDICVRWIAPNGTVRTTRTKMHYNDHDEKGNVIPSLTNDDTVGFTSGWSVHGMRRYHCHDYYCENLYPELNLAPYLKIRGLDLLSPSQLEAYINLPHGIFHEGSNPIQFIKYLLKYPFVETLVKKGDFETLHTFFSCSRKEFETVLPSYLIMKRHGYTPTELKLWIDMVLLYHKAGKDIRNPRFICPENLQQGHIDAQTLYDKRREREARRRLKEFQESRPRDIFWFLDNHPEEELKCVGNDEYLYRLAEDYGGLEPGWHIFIEDFYDETTGEPISIVRRTNDDGLPPPLSIHDYYHFQRDILTPYSLEIQAKNEEKFNKLKSRFFNIEFGDDELLIKSLDSLEEYRDEGYKMFNCVESNEYWKKPGSLVLSVRKGDKRVADVELSLSTFKILQCWGPCNQPTPFKEKIEKLINDNILLIKGRMDI